MVFPFSRSVYKGGAFRCLYNRPRGIYDGQVYALQLPTSWHNCNIAQLEMINILVALKVWDKQWAGQRIVINCDNQAVVAVLTNDHVMKF